MKVAQKALHYFHSAISNHLSEKPKICLVLYYGHLINTGWTALKQFGYKTVIASSDGIQDG